MYLAGNIATNQSYDVWTPRRRQTYLPRPGTTNDFGANGLGLIPFAAVAASTGGPTNPVGIVMTALSVLSSLAKLVGSGHPSRAEATWDSYKKAQGQARGSSYDEAGFAEIIKGAFDANRATFKADREQTMQQLAKLLVDGLINGTLSPTMSAAQMFQVLVDPWIRSGQAGINAAEFYKNSALAPLFVDIIDRYISNLPITRADMKSQPAGQYSAHAPLILDALQAWALAHPQSGVPTAALPAPAPSASTVYSTTPAPATQLLPNVSIQPIPTPLQLVPSAPSNFPTANQGGALPNPAAPASGPNWALLASLAIAAYKVLT